MRSWVNEWFEAEESKIMFGTFSAFVGLAPDDAGGGSISYLFANIIQDGGNNIVKGGFINLPIALSKYIISHGGEIMTNAAVKNIIVNCCTYQHRLQFHLPTWVTLSSSLLGSV